MSGIDIPGSPSASGIFLAKDDIGIPTTDIVSYAFGQYGTYDEGRQIYVNAADDTQFISASKARRMVRQIVSGLLTQGLKEGECVCLHTSNDIAYPVLWLGTIGAGGCASGSNPSYTAPELVHHLVTSGAKFIVAQLDHFAPIAQAARECRIPNSRIFVIASADQQVPDGYQSWEVLLRCGECDWRSFEGDETKSRKTVAALAATSGTTGLPKAALISHQYLVVQSRIVEEHNRGRPHQISQLLCLPIFHAFAAQLGLVMPLRMGFTTYFMSRFNLPDFARFVQRFSITDTAVVPPIVTALLKLDSGNWNLLQSLRYVLCAAAPMEANVQTKLYDLLSPEAVIAQCWGTTETGWVTAFSWFEKDESGSVGRLLPTTKLKIIDDEGRLITRDEVPGEAHVHSESLFNGYLSNEDANSNSFGTDGFYKTGDRVYFKEGRFFIDGRIKDTIKVKGWQVSPLELEKILITHPQIIDTAVVGVNRRNDDGIDETLPRAFIVLDNSHQEDNIATEEEIQAFVSSRVVSYKRLTGGVKFVKEIPRSVTGKILRRLLPDSAK